MAYHTGRMKRMKRKNTEKRSDAENTSFYTGTTQKKRINQVDLLKGLAIISVILIHTFPDELLALIGAPFYLWQAVPVFLLLAAFTGSLVYTSRNRKNLSDLYDPSLLARRFRRILLPFSLIWVIQVVVILYLLPGDLSLHTRYVTLFASGIPGIAANFFSGGSGPGNYFIPVILQQILLLPVFYWLAVRFSPDRMLVIACAANIVLEYGAVLFGVPPGIYTNSYLPYMMLGALGVWLAFQSGKTPPWLVVAGALSALYITAVYYFGFHVWFIDTAGEFFNVFSYFWTVLLVAAGLRFLSPQSVTLLSGTVRELGRASWHIFLVQMTFLAFFEGAMIASITASIPGSGIWHALVCQALLTVPSLGVCLLLGYGFYRSDERVKTWMHGKTPSRPPGAGR